MGRHVLIVVRRGHITIAAQGREPVVCSQGYACHSLHGPFDVHVPRTKQAEYIVITYRMIPENNPWTLFGPLSTMSEIKIHYMLDELIRTAEEIHTHSEAEEAAQQFRKRMILERILFIFLYESRMQQDEKSSSQSVEETLSYINEHYMLKLTLPLIARRAGMSEGHYTVLFKQHTGMTMTSYLRKLRIEKARQMFRQTRLPGISVSAVGAIGFIGLIAPHIARSLVGARARWLIPLASLVGADLMLLLGDCLGRILIVPREVPVGIMTAVLGAPYFVYLLRRERHRSCS
jgi:AraC-like DNA-binding protein